MDKLLVLRGIAAFTVVAYHTQNYIFPTLVDKIHFADINFSWLIVANGKMAVVVFFALSGYLMFKGYLAERYKLSPRGSVEFLRSRAQRIMPLYFFLVAFFVLFAHPQLLTTEGSAILWQLLTFTYEGAGGFVTAFWSISTEIQFYLLMPMLALVFIKFLHSTRQRMVLVAAVAVGSILLRHSLNVNIGGTPNVIAPIFLFFDAFIIGGFAAFILKEFSLQLKSFLDQTGWLLVAIIAGLSVLPLSSLYWQQFNNLGYHTFGVTFISIYTAIFIIAAELSTTKGFKKNHYSFSGIIMRPSTLPEFAGAISYGVYLWHSVVIDRLWFFPVEPYSVRQNMVRIIMVCFVSSIFAYLTYKYVESRKPSYAFSDRFMEIVRLYTERVSRAYKGAQVTAIRIQTIKLRLSPRDTPLD